WLSVAKKDCGAEDPFERGNQASIFLAAFLHSERIEHFGAALEANHLALLLDSQSCEKYWYETILAEGEAIIRMTSDLQNKMSVAAFEEKLTRRRSTNWKATENEREAN